jgi:hypothetical protein
MKYNVEDSINILRRTPYVLDTLLRGLPDGWLDSNEGENTWSPYDVLGHLIHGERTDWIARLEIILLESGEKKFKPFDRFAQFEESKGKSMHELLDEFKIVREKNLQIFISKRISEKEFDRTAIHPAFGEVHLSNLLSTWVVHDLDHIFQIVRVMSHQYNTEVGPWKQYLRILRAVN